jgi:hypothetical protein
MKTEIPDSWRGAALVIGISAAEYARKRKQGLLWCTDCRAWKKPEEFAISRARPRGRTHKCRPCEAKRFAAWHAKHGEKLNARRKAQRAMKRAAKAEAGDGH